MAAPDPSRAHFYPALLTDMWQGMQRPEVRQAAMNNFLATFTPNVMTHPFAPMEAGYGAPSPALGMPSYRTGIDAQPLMGPAAMAAQKGGDQVFDAGMTTNPDTGFQWVEPKTAPSIFLSPRRMLRR